MRRKRTDVLIVPDWRRGNPYLGYLSAELEREGFHTSFDHFPDGYFKLTQLANKHRSAGVIHIHWIRWFIDPFFWSRSELKFNIRLLLLIGDMVLCRARGVRIIWTLHNLVEHESAAPDLELRVRAWVARLANGVIAHSAEALETAAKAYSVRLTRKWHVIPHGSYIGIYKYSAAIKDSLKTQYAIEDSHLVLLFFGAIRRYKGLDLLLANFRAIPNSNFRLIIAGRPFDEATEDWVRQETKNDERIRLALGFVPEEQVAPHFALADAVVMPFKGILTSGSLLLAMSFGKCVILPESGRVLGIPGDAGALYYEDENDVGLGDVLETLPEKDLKAMGEHNLGLVRRLDWRKIAQATGKVYAGASERIVWTPQTSGPQS